jgi:hypothetical protein
LLRTRLSLRPLFSWAKTCLHDSGAFAPRDCAGVSIFIARSKCDDPPSLAMRAIVGLESAEAPLRVGGTNSWLLVCGSMDCLAEPVIGPRFARTRWLALTVEATGCLKFESEIATRPVNGPVARLSSRGRCS